MKFWVFIVTFVLIGCSLYKSDDRKNLEDNLLNLVDENTASKVFPLCGTNTHAPALFDELDPLIESVSSEIEVYYDAKTQRYFFLGTKDNLFVYCKSNKTSENHILKSNLLSHFKQHLQEQQL